MEPESTGPRSGILTRQKRAYNRRRVESLNAKSLSADSQGESPEGSRKVSKHFAKLFLTLIDHINDRELKSRESAISKAEKGAQAEDPQRAAAEAQKAATCARV